MTIPHYPILKQALKTYGIQSQFRMTIEECSELSNAICKLQRERIIDDDVITEIADVLIMCWQMAIHFGIGKVDKEIKYKINRLEQRLKHDIQLKQQTDV